MQETPFYKAKKEMAALNQRLEEQERALGVDHEETRAESRELDDRRFLFYEQGGKIKERGGAVLSARPRRTCADSWARAPARPRSDSGSNLGSLLKAQEGKLSLAEPFLRRALEGRREERALERDHPGGGCIISLGGNVGSLLQDQGKFGLAEPFFRRALEGYERTLERDHPDAHAQLGQQPVLAASRVNYSSAKRSAR